MVANKQLEISDLQAYEAPEIFECGSFQEETGMVGFEGAEPFMPQFHTRWW
ncbi:hypothetical protein ACIRBY_00050 [Streptomyces sp. NPDC096136]|uniref:hypothetical protein n=1 Tax=Streptomyces sp. NPDC096136 TaxID=3366076 RepID=UPI003813E78A